MDEDRAGQPGPRLELGEQPVDVVDVLGALHLGDHDDVEAVADLGDEGHEVVDHGPVEYDPEDDYPIFCIPTAAAVVDDPGSLGIVVGGSGNGEQIAANKVTGVRCALVWSEETAVLAREHNDANVVSVGGRMHSLEDMTRFVEVFLATPFPGDERHVRRIGQLSVYDETRELPPLPESALRGPGGTDSPSESADA